MGGGNVTITKEGNLVSFYTVNKAPIKHLKVYFSPKQAGTGDPSPSNIRLISGITGCDTVVSGKNILNINRTKGDPDPKDLSGSTSPRVMDTNHYYKGIQSENWYHDPYTNVTISNNTIIVNNLNNNSYGAGFPVRIKSGEKYTLSFTAEKSLVSFGFYDRNWHYLYSSDAYSNINHITITAAQNAYYMVVVFRAVAFNTEAYTYSNIQLECGEIATEYEPYRDQTYTLDWTNDIGTIYGGYVDLITGELVQIEKKLILNGSSSEEWWEYDTYDQYKGFALNNTGLKSGTRQSGYASWMPVVSKSTSNNLECWLGVNNTVIYCASTADLISNYSVANWRLYLAEHPLEIVIPLKTPIAHQLTPTQLSTLIGRNNIWSNADYVEVEYDLAESNDELYRRRNIILKSAPHIETVSGNIAHFETDIAVPIKSAVVRFSPVQEGSGDPSPTNVRAISGWSSVNITYCGKNLLNTNECYLTNMSQSNGVFTNTAADTRSSVNFTLREQNGQDANQVTRECFYINTSTAGKFIQNFTINNNDTIYLLLKHNGSSRDLRMLFRWAAGTGSFRFMADIDSADPTVIGGFTLHNIQIIKLNDNDEYETYTGSTIPINWQTAAGTIYGGYLDLTSRKLVQTYGSMVLDGTEDGWATYGAIERNDFCAVFNIANKKRGNQISICDKLKNVDTAYAPSNYASGRYSDHPNLKTMYFCMPNAEITTITGFKQWLSENNLQFVYELEEPVEYQLSPQILRTLRGVNNIWSNANGPIEVSYWTH